MDPSLHRIIKEVFQTDGTQLDDHVALKELNGWDSLAHMEFVVTLEKKFNIVLTGDEIATMTSIGAIKDVLATKDQVAK